VPTYFLTLAAIQVGANLRRTDSGNVTVTQEATRKVCVSGGSRGKSLRIASSPGASASGQPITVPRQ